MNLLTLFIIAVSLSMDSMVSSVGLTISSKRNYPINILKISLSLSITQAVMTVFGWLLGDSIYEWVKPIDHWISLLLLLFIGLRMIYEGINGGEAKIYKDNFLFLIAVSIATSIDGFAFGFLLSIIDVPIVVPFFMILVVTFIITFMASSIFRLFFKKFERLSVILGGSLLIFIGLSIFVEHMVKHI